MSQDQWFALSLLGITLAVGGMSWLWLYETKSGQLTIPSDFTATAIFIAGLVLVFDSVNPANFTSAQLALLAFFGILVGVATILVMDYLMHRKKSTKTPPSNGQAGESLVEYAVILVIAAVTVFLVVVDILMPALLLLGQWLAPILDGIQRHAS